jgi:L-asparaginase II
VAQILQAIGATADDLVLGDEGLAHGCSGAHTALLMLAKHLNVPWQGYEDPTHPVQIQVAQTIRSVCGLSSSAPLDGATDGCGVPTFYLPLRLMAQGYARLVDPTGLLAAESAALTQIAQAMRRYPAWLSGKHTWETRLAEASGHRLIIKPGAEGVVLVGLVDRGWGIALKIHDGGYRGIPALLIHVLRELKVLPAKDPQLADLAEPALFDTTGRRVGELRIALSLTHV